MYVNFIIFEACTMMYVNLISSYIFDNCSLRGRAYNYAASLAFSDATINSQLLFPGLLHDDSSQSLEGV